MSRQVQDDVTAEAPQRAAGRAAGRSVVRRPAKYSSSSRATSSSRAGASSTRGLTCGRERGQHGVVVLDAERHADQSARASRRGAACRRGCPRSGRRRRAGRAAAAATPRRDVQVREPARRRRCTVRSSMTPPGRSLDRSRRRVATPSEPARRAAAAVPPSEGGDLVVGQPAEVVVGDDVPLLGGQRREGRPQVEVAGPGRRAAPGSGSSATGIGVRAARRDDVDRLAVRDRHEPRLDVRAVGQVRVGAQGRQERLRPGVVGVDRPDHRAAHAQHGGAVLDDDTLEGFLHHHSVQTRRPPRV